MGSEWDLWVWLVGGVVRRYIHVDILIIIITFPYTFISSFFSSSIPTYLLIFLMFFRSFIHTSNQIQIGLNTDLLPPYFCLLLNCSCHFRKWIEASFGSQ